MQNSLNQDYKPKKKKTIPILIGVIVGILAVVGIITAIILMNNGDTNTSREDNNNSKKIDVNYSEYTKNNEEYFIGGTGPLTGAAASYGISVQRGATIAIEEINAKGGLNGKMFKFEMKDDRAAAEDAIMGYYNLYEAGMQVGLGSVTSGSCVAFSTGAREDNLFFITPSASADNCIEAPNAFRVCFGDPDQGKLAAAELAANYESIGVIYDSSDAYSNDIFVAFKEEMGKMGKSFVEQSFTAENKTNFSTQVTALTDCDVIFLPIYHTEASLIAKEAVAQENDAVLFGCDGLEGIQYLIEGVPNKVMYITPFDETRETHVVRNFVKTYKQKYGETPDQFAADGYDAVMAIYYAMEKAGVDNVRISPDELCEMLKKSILEIEYEGATGTMTWSENGEVVKSAIIKAVN